MRLGARYAWRNAAAASPIDVRALLALIVTLGAALLVLHLIHNPTMENFLTGLWQQIHPTRQ